VLLISERFWQERETFPAILKIALALSSQRESSGFKYTDSFGEVSLPRAPIQSTLCEVSETLPASIGHRWARRNDSIFMLIVRIPWQVMPSGDARPI